MNNANTPDVPENQVRLCTAVDKAAECEFIQLVVETGAAHGLIYRMCKRCRKYE